MVTWNELRTFVLLVLRYWWVVLLSIALACGTAFGLSRFETRLYMARTTLMVGNTLNSLTPDPNLMGMTNTLARNYADLARREPIVKPVAEKLKLPFVWSQIPELMLATNVTQNASLLEISIVDSDPERAAAIANALAQQLIDYSPTSPEKIQADKAAIETQMTASSVKIKEFDAKLADLKDRYNKATSASDLTELNAQINELEGARTKEQGVFTTLSNSKSATTLNSLTVFERAEPPSIALPSKKWLAVGLAGIAGLLLSLGAIYVLSRFDQRWKPGRDVREWFHLGELGQVPVGPPLLVAASDPNRVRERAMRDAYTNILLAAPEGRINSLLVSSPEASQDRAAFSVDLAQMFSRSGHSVLLVDADLETPNLTRLLMPDGQAAHVVNQDEATNDIWRHLRLTPITNVALLPSGLKGEGATALVPSMRWPALIRELRSVADVIIFDGPSVLSGADAALIAPHVDGTVLFVAPSTDLREDIEKSKARLSHNPATRLFGAVTAQQTKKTPAWDPTGYQLPPAIHTPALEMKPTSPADPAVNHAPAVEDVSADEDRVVIITPIPAEPDIVVDLPPTPKTQPTAAAEPIRLTNSKRGKKRRGGAQGTADGAVIVDADLSPIVVHTRTRPRPTVMRFTQLRRRWPAHSAVSRLGRAQKHS